MQDPDRSLRILVVSNVYFPDRGGHAVPATEFAEGLAERGHHVDVVTSYPYYPEWSNKSSANLWRVAEQELNGVRVTRYGMYIPSPPANAVARLLQEGTFLLSLCRHLLARRRYDAVVAYCPMLASVVYTTLRTSLFGERLWINVQDLPAEAATGTGLARPGLVWTALGWFQRRLFLRSVTVSAIAPTMVDKVQAYGFPPGEVQLFPNFLKKSIIETVDELGDHRSAPELGIRPFRLLYAGNIGRKQNLLEYCNALASSNLDFEFRVFGAGAEAETLKRRLAGINDPRFVTGPFLSEREFISELLSTDLFVVTETPDADASFVPSKLIPAFATRTPILAICDEMGALGQEVLGNDVGFVSDWSDPQHATLSAMNALSDPVRWVALRSALRERQGAYSRSDALDHATRLVGNLGR